MVVHTNTSNSRAGIFITVASTLKQLKTAGEVNIPSFLKQAPTRGQHLLRSLKNRYEKYYIFGKIFECVSNSQKYLSASQKYFKVNDSNIFTQKYLMM